MNAQEVFNTVATHLFTQGFPAKDVGGSCQYRTKNGSMCAVGCLISLDEYSPEYEGLAIDDMLTKAVGTDLFNTLAPHRELLNELQMLHDEGYAYNYFDPADDEFDEDDVNAWASTEHMQGWLRGIAKKFKLDNTVLNTLSFKDR